MKAAELMIGDWVILYDKPLKVQYIYNNGYDDVVAEIVEEGTNEYGVYEEIKDVPSVNCSPIPLTAEILEKNGRWYDVEDMWRHDEVDFGIERWNGGFQCYEINQIKLHSVHELQRALRCCGLWDMANNFKI